MSKEERALAWLTEKPEPHEDPTHSFAPAILTALAREISADLGGLQKAVDAPQMNEDEDG